MPNFTIQEALALGMQHHQAGRLPEAESIYQQILVEHPDHADVLHLLGALAHQRGNSEQAIELIRRAIALNPTFASYHSNLGLILKDAQQYDQAIAEFEEAISIRRDNADDQFNLGLLFQIVTNWDRAVGCYREAIVQQRDLTKAYNNLGNVLKDLGRCDEAVDVYRQGIENCEPMLASLYSNLGNVLKDQGRLDEALASYRHAMMLQPNDHRLQSNLVYSLHFHPAYDMRQIAEENRRWNERFARPYKPRVRVHANVKDASRKLRVGYVSPDFYNQAECFFVAPLLEKHNHDQFEIHCYASVQAPDMVTTRLQKSADVWHDVIKLTDDALADRIQADGIDILVDLTMHMGSNRLPLFARKPAPVQATWLAYPGSTGLETIDYRLTDAFMEPLDADDSWSSEKTVRLPDCWCCYDPVIEFPPVNTLPALREGYVTFGSLNNACKNNQAMLRLWARVLAAVPQSRLVLLSGEGAHRESIRALFGEIGVAPDRVQFVMSCPRVNYLQYYQAIDIGLDPLPYNGITTTCDALFMGVPVISLVGKTPAGRAGLSLLSNVEVPELVVHSKEQFVHIARALAEDTSRLAKLRSTLRQRMQASPLMDATRFARNVEAAYRDMWKRWCQTQNSGD